MFVIEDPSGQKGKGYRELQKSRVNAHASIVSHERRRRVQERKQSRLERMEGVDRPVQGFVSTPQTPPVNQYHQSQSQSQSQPPHMVTYRLNTDFYACDVQPSRSARPGIHDGNSVLSYMPQPIHYALTHTNDRGSRNLQFYQERTAIECSGWHDLQFWTEHALQVADSHLGVKYALESLGACHEMMEVSDTDRKRALRSLAISRGREAFDYLIMFYDKMSASSIFTAYLVLSTIMLLIDEDKLQSMLKRQYNLILSYRRLSSQYSSADRLSIDGCIEPVMLRQMGITGSFIDYMYILRRAPISDFVTERPPDIPDSFISIRRARNTLEAALTFATCQVKSKLWTTVDVLACENRFLRALDNYAPVLGIVSEQDRCNLLLLEMSAKFGFVMVQRLLEDANDELFFDAYTPLYARFAECLKRIFQYERREARNSGMVMSFGTDGLLGLAGQIAFRWCRDPKIRREIIQLFVDSPRREANGESFTWARGCQAVVQFEERGLVNPRSCHDIPLKNRIRLNVSRFLPGRIHHIQYFVHPWGPHDIGNFYLQDCSDATFFTNIVDKNNDVAFLTIGRGYCSFFNPESSGGYFTLKNLKFFFPIPAV